MKVAPINIPVFGLLNNKIKKDSRSCRIIKTSLPLKFKEIASLDLLYFHTDSLIDLLHGLLPYQRFVKS